MLYNYPGSLFKMHIARWHPQIFKFRRLGSGPGVCIFNKKLGCAWCRPDGPCWETLSQRPLLVLLPILQQCSPSNKMMTSVVLKNGGGGRLFDKFKNCSETHLHISLFQDSQILKNANVLCVSPEERQRIQCNKNIFDHQNTSFSFK